jgi:methylated-DNA-[protein]-cysteine S-methyltransferase
MTTARPDWTTYESPLGRLTLLAGPSGLSHLYFEGRAPQVSEAARREMPETARQLDDYFAGRRRCFDLVLDLRGTTFHREVWRLLMEIPYRTTTTYGEMARRVDEDLYPPGVEPYRRPQLVGAAIGANPVPILVPCHRVIGADGSLTGYLGGLQRKQALLDLEGASATGRRPRPDQDSRQLAIL